MLNYARGHFWENFFCHHDGHRGCQIPDVEACGKARVRTTERSASA